MKRWLGLVLLVSACSVPTPSRQYACRGSADCESGRTCEDGFCVVSTIDAAMVSTVDAAIDAAPDATIVQTFTVGNDCDGSRCRGGYGGTKDTTNGPPTADHLCTAHSFPRATSFSFGTNQPGGRFCYWATNQWSCDGSCSGCNPMTAVTCESP